MRFATDSRSGLVLGLLATLALAAPDATLAQAASLDRVEELARLGRTEEARTALTEWWGGARDDATQRDLQRGLWLRGRLTVDPVQAELDFQRLVVLYPSGPFTPQALLRLAQAAHANGDAAAAQRHVEALARDYPSAPARQQAEAWLRAAGPPPPASGTRAAAAGGAAAPTSPVPVAAAAGAPSGAAPSGTAAAGGAAAGQRPATGGVLPDTAGAIRAAAGRPVAPADVTLDWSVQFGAFSDEERAFTLQRELVDAGLAARLVRVAGSGFLHVRIGRFATRDEAARQLDSVSRAGFTAAIVRDDRAEEVVRR